MLFVTVFNWINFANVRIFCTYVWLEVVRSMYTDKFTKVFSVHIVFTYFNSYVWRLIGIKI